MMLPGEALEAVNQILGYVRSATIRKVRPPATSVFVGHGRADDWKTLAAFLEDELKCKVVEFNNWQNLVDSLLSSSPPASRQESPCGESHNRRGGTPFYWCQNAQAVVAGRGSQHVEACTPP